MLYCHKMTVSYEKMNLPEKVRAKRLPEILSDSDLSFLIPGTADRRYSLVKRALARGDLIQIRRGLYCLGDLYRTIPIDNFSLAHRIYGPSHISFESALSYWGLIPEAVYTTTSATNRRSQEFETPLGVYAYTRIPYKPLFTGVTRVADKISPFFIATPLRALLDYIYYSKKTWTLRSIEGSLRLEHIPEVNREEFKALKEFFTHYRVQKFLKEYERKMF